MKSEKIINYKIEKIRSASCSEFMNLHTNMLNNIEKVLQNGKKEKISMLTSMEQQSFELFEEIDKYQNNLLRKFIDITNEEIIIQRNQAETRVYEEDYSLENLPINRYEVYTSEIPLEKKELYNFYDKGTVLVFGECSEEIYSWITSMGLNIKEIPEEIFDADMESYFDCSVVGVLGLAKKGWSEKQCYSFVRQMFFSAKYTSIAWYKNHVKPFFVVVTRLGGKFGMGSQDQEFTTGSLSGLCKTAAREWMSNVSTHYIDVDSHMEEDCLVKCISDEIKYGTEVEVGYPSFSQRVGLRLREKYENRLDTRRPDENDVFLVSGGGKGITSICIKEMAKRFKCKFILFGRTKLEKEFIDMYKGLNLEEIREIIIKNKQAINESIKYIDANEMAKGILSQREIRDTLKALKEAGSEVIYFTCNVKDEKRLKEVVEEGTRKLGRITGVIHGAGLLADKLLNKKTEEDFANVFGVKYFGMKNIMNEVDSHNLKYIFVFSSIAGFFGNFGQSDYSCGNEYLNHFVRYWKARNPECKVMAINWGPWDAGMPDHALKVAMLRRGKTLIQPEIGKLFFADAFAKIWDKEACQIVVNDVNGLGGAL